MSNRLSKETSPYLLQHQNNPVDWYPWGDEALQRAKKENKPILLSIGYSACHWCHVMEHESFENPQTARLMNDNFISIKVDREERPDLDQIYQNVAQAMTMGGGWPLTVFLTPDLKPFFGGTYFPPEDRYGRPGFPKVLQALSQAFTNDPDGVGENAQKLTEYIVENESLQAGSPSSQNSSQPGSKISSESFRKICDGILDRVDRQHGGFGHAPKFPNTMLLSFLWRYGNAVNLTDARESVRMSLTQMAYGGIYDQLGGGFHRYSVDEAWSVPHFEKMLYDNALLLKLYSEVLLSESAENFSSAEFFEEERKLYLRVISETVDYVFREMTTPDGVFYSAQDADTEGEEGKFFVWDLSDLAQVLTPAEVQVFALRYGVTATGNFEHGKTVLYIARGLPEISREVGIPIEQVTDILNRSKKKLLEARALRVAPGLDHKVLTSWNGLMISGLAWVSQALIKNGQAELGEKVLKAAVRAFDFIKKNLTHDSDRLFSTYQFKNEKGQRVGQPKLNAYLDDYSFMAMAALDLSRFVSDTAQVKSYIEDCDRWIGVIHRHFEDSSGPGFFFTSDDHERLIHRPKTIFDQAIPSGTAVALTCMVALSELDVTPHTEKYTKDVESQLPSLYRYAERNSFGLGEILSASLLSHLGPVTILGENSQSLAWHPHFFQKPRDASSQEKGWVICHQRTCGLPQQSLDSVNQELRRQIAIR